MLRLRPQDVCPFSPQTRARSFSADLCSAFSGGPIEKLTPRGVAKLVSRLVWDQEAAGSSPVTPTKKVFAILTDMNALGPTTWDEVFATWAASEEQNPGWINVATKIKGWPDWRSWRMFTATSLHLPARTWTLEEFTDPMTEIPSMLVGPFTGWQKRLPAPNTHTFADLVNIPEQYNHFGSNVDLQKLENNFPLHTKLTGLRRPDGRIVLIEGHHRATVVALAAHDKKTISFPTPVTIFMAELGNDESELLDAVLARGSSKNPPESTTDSEK